LPLKELVKEYNGKVRVVFKNMVVHPQVTNAHQAGCAAGRQKKFHAFMDIFWEKGFKARKMDDANIEAMAKEIGLDMGRFKADKDSDYCKNLVQNDMAELQKFRVNSTPSFFVNGQHVGGALPKESFKQLIDEKLKTADSADYYERVIMTKGEKQFKSRGAAGGGGGPAEAPPPGH
jgi:protein-disulfide isomerase